MGIFGPEKGEFGGECRRTACTNGPARWANPNMSYEGNGRHFYCGLCARFMNRENAHMPYWKMCYETTDPNAK